MGAWGPLPGLSRCSSGPRTARTFLLLIFQGTSRSRAERRGTLGAGRFARMQRSTPKCPRVAGGSDSRIAAGRPYSLLAGPTRSWQAPLAPGRPFSLLAGSTRSWQALLAPGRPYFVPGRPYSLLAWPLPAPPIAGSGSASAAAATRHCASAAAAAALTVSFVSLPSTPVPDLLDPPPLADSPALPFEECRPPLPRCLAARSLPRYPGAKLPPRLAAPRPRLQPCYLGACCILSLLQ